MPHNGTSLSQIEKMIDQLGEGDKIKLVRKLEAKTLSARWRKFLQEVDKRRRKHPLSQREIEAIVESARQEIHERSHR